MLSHHHNRPLEFWNLKKYLDLVTLTGTYELPEDDLNNDRNMLERFLSVSILTF